MGQGARFIKHDGVGLGQSFQIFSALDGDVVVAALAHGGEDGQRHGELEGAGEVHHQDGDGAGHVAGQRVGGHGTGQAPGHQTVGQLQGAVLRAGLQLLGLLDHGDDLVVTVGAALGLGGKDAFALFHHSAGVNGGTGSLAHRHGLAGQGGLVHNSLALQNGAVQRDHVAGADHDLVARVDFRQGHQDLAALGTHPDLIHVQGHAAGQIIEALFAGPLFQQGAQIQQEHHRAGGAEIAAQYGGADAQCIQHFHLQLALQQAADAFPDERDGAPDGVGRRDGSGQEQLAGVVAGHQGEHLILIFPVDLPAVVGGDQHIQLRVIKFITGQQGNGFLAAAGVGQHHVACPLIHGGVVDAVLMVQVSFQHIGTVEGHPHSVDMHPHPAPAFM